MSAYPVRRTWTWMAIPVLLVATGLGIWISGFFTPWSPVNCWTDSIDINSGRIRHQRFLLYRYTSDTTEDSALTRALDPADLAGVTPEWHAVVTLSPGVRNSPHYAYHGAIYQIRELQIAWEVGQITPAAQRATAKHLLVLWKASGSYFGANKALSDLANAAFDAETAARVPLDLGDLPPEWR
jgi:hypothetical protein